jgi:hypothetical protein
MWYPAVIGVKVMSNRADALSFCVACALPTVTVALAVCET